mgnify:CR=1 FL=1
MTELVIGISGVRIKVEISAEQLKDAFFKRIFRNIASEKIASSPILRTFEGAIFDETISRYQLLTEEFQLLSQK